MKKLTVSEAANFFGITKEAIYNRVRRGKLRTVNENGLKYVVVEENINSMPKTRQSTKSSTEKYTQFLEKEVEELKTKVKKLESENAKLIKEKLEILEQSKKELEEIFATRDEQLKQILHLMNEKYALPKIQSVEVIDTGIKEHKAKNIELKSKKTKAKKGKNKTTKKKKKRGKK